MSFLNQLKNQATALQSQRVEQDHRLEEKTAQVEAACRIMQPYLQDLARQLNVIQPAGPRFSLDGRTPWPAMKLVDFRADARRKLLRDREVFDYVAMGWKIVPQVGQPVGGMVTVNFPPDLQRVESRLNLGNVQHERKDVRHPETNALQAYVFHYTTQARGSVVVTADHDRGMIHFRLLNLGGFEVVNTTWPATKITGDVMDELAKLVVGQPSRFA